MSVLDPRKLSFDELIEREWLLVDGAGGYASSTVIGLNTRKYHGVLVAAVRPPFGRVVGVSRVEETVSAGGRSWALASVEYPGVIHPAGHGLIRAFQGKPYPRWLFQAGDWTIEKSLRFTPGSTGEVVLTYTLLGGGTDESGEEWRGEDAAKPVVELTVRPLIALRAIHELSYRSAGRFAAPVVDEAKQTVEIREAGGGARNLHIAHEGTFAAAPDWYLSTVYRRERERGYAAQEDLWTPGLITLQLSPGRTAKVAFSVSPIDLAATKRRLRQGESDRSLLKHKSAAAPTEDEAILRLLDDACAQFVATPPAIVPQFPWSPLSPRDILIALPGVLLARAQFQPAASILTSLAGRLRGGLLPSQLSETDEPPATYESSDASLWLIHAIWWYYNTSDDAETTRTLWPAIAQILDAYVAGTKPLGVGLDGDTLLRVRETGVGTTWMNAKIGASPITPRAGRPVELNALWHNALLAAADLAEKLSPVGSNVSTIQRLRSAAAVHQAAFNRRFWNGSIHCLNDVVYDNGEDASIRPNQLLAISLPFAVLDAKYRPAVMRTVRDKLLTPFGLRTLDPASRDYRGRYGGDVQSRDRAYHQGSVFPWLLGPYVTALAKTLGRSERTAVATRSILSPLIGRIAGEGLGQVPELFDGAEPHRAGGAIADARAAGELFRVWQGEVMESNKRLPNGAGTTQLSATTGQTHR